MLRALYRRCRQPDHPVVGAGMSIEKDAFHRLELLGALEPNEVFSPHMAEAGAYTARVRVVLEERPLPDGDQPAAGATAQTVMDALNALERYAAELLRADTPHQHRVPHLRVRCRELNLPLRDPELKRLLADARRQALGVAEGIGSRPLNLAPVPWLAEGLLMRGCMNLLLGPPKIGKTSLTTGLIGAWAAGSDNYLGLPLIGPCPPVLIVGPDQPEGDWGRLLLSCGLLDAQHRLRPPVIDLFTAGQPLQLDAEGIERIATYAAEHKGLLVLIDSLAAVTRTLGISENDAEIASPLMALLEALEPHGATPVLIHHSGKASIGGSPSLASRGSSAIPAIASQTVSLSRLAEGQPGAPPDRRVVVKTEGRGGSPIELLAERTDAGWISHGDAEAVQAERWRQQEEGRLPDRHGEALEAVRERWDTDQLPMDAATLAEVLELKGDAVRKARALLDSLVRRGLLTSELRASRVGRKKVYAPSGGVRSPGGGVSSQPSEPSQPSGPPTVIDSPNGEKPYGETVRRDRRDRRDRRTHPPKGAETLRTPAGGPPDPAVLPLEEVPPPSPPVRLVPDDDAEDDPHWGPPRTA